MRGDDPCPRCGADALSEDNGFVGVRSVGGTTVPHHVKRLACDECGWYDAR